MTSVKVAVRCRPFNDREKNFESTCIIRMDGKSTFIKNPVSFSNETWLEITVQQSPSFWQKFFTLIIVAYFIMYSNPKKLLKSLLSTIATGATTVMTWNLMVIWDLNLALITQIKQKFLQIW